MQKFLRPLFLVVPVVSASACASSQTWKVHDANGHPLQTWEASIANDELGAKDALPRGRDCTSVRRDYAETRGVELCPWPPVSLNSWGPMSHERPREVVVNVTGGTKIVTR